MAHTMREVAKRAGVSLATVSRVLSNTQYISEETRTRVLKAVSEFSYFKNIHARRLATGSSDLFGLIHIEVNAITAAAAFVLGLLSGELRRRSDSLLPAILVHAIFNVCSAR